MTSWTKDVPQKEASTPYFVNQRRNLEKFHVICQRYPPRFQPLISLLPSINTLSRYLGLFLYSPIQRSPGKGDGHHTIMGCGWDFASRCGQNWASKVRLFLPSLSLCLPFALTATTWAYPCLFSLLAMSLIVAAVWDRLRYIWVMSAHASTPWRGVEKNVLVSNHAVKPRGVYGFVASLREHF